MQNSVQPFINFAHANLETYSRFAKSPEMAEINKTGIEKYLEFVQETLWRVAHSDAFAEWIRVSVDNYARFIDEYTQSILGIVSQGQDIIGRQVEQGGRRLQQLTDDAGRVVDAGADAVKQSASAGADAAEKTASAGADAVKGAASNVNHSMKERQVEAEQARVRQNEASQSRE